MCKQEVGKDTGGDRLHVCEVTRQLARSCYKVFLLRGVYIFLVLRGRFYQHIDVMTSALIVDFLNR